MITLVDVPLPANTLSFLQEIYSIASFEFYPALGDKINSLLNLLPSEALTQSFADLGFESPYVLNNMGSMVLFYLGYLFLILLQKTLEKCKRRSQRVATANRYLKRSLYYNPLITGLYQGYSVIALSVTLGFYKIYWDSYGASIQSTMCICFAVLLVVAPAILFEINVRNFDSLDSEEMQQQFGSFYPDLRV